MTWVAWRQRRTELILAVALLAAAAAFLIPTGLPKFQSFESSGLAACLPASEPDCAGLTRAFIADYSSLISVIGWFNLAPFLIGVLFAAPVVMEFEQRTYRLAWTQSVTRLRWFATNLAVSATGAAAITGVFILAMTWWFTPLNRVDSPFNASFNTTGVVPIAYVLFALGLTIALGALTRRAVLAVVLAFFIFFVARESIENIARPAYLAPIEQMTTQEAQPADIERAWVLDQGFSATDGSRLDKGEVAQICETDGARADNEAPPASTGTCASSQILNRLVYHPADRFWTFQAIESGIFLSLASLLLGATAYMLRSRG
jgi:hypothetical protein